MNMSLLLFNIAQLKQQTVFIVVTRKNHLSPQVSILFNCHESYNPLILFPEV